jgi:hypothetical protein
MSRLDRTLPHANNGLLFVSASARGPGAVRYRCPESGSYILLTDSAALQRLSMRPVQCAGCGGEHRLIRGDEPLIESAA